MLMIIVMLMLNAVMAQTHHKQSLPDKDFNKWHRLEQQIISPSGKWFAYTLAYDNGNDSLFVKHSNKKTKYNFPLGQKGVFSINERWFSFKLPNMAWGLLDLKSGNIERFSSVINAEFLKQGDFLLLTIKNVNTKNLVIINLKNNNKKVIENVKIVESSPNKKHAIFIKENNAVGILMLEKEIRTNIVQQAGELEVKEPTWNKQSNAFAFLRESKRENHLKVYFYDHIFDIPNLKVLSAENIFDDNRRIVIPIIKPALLISPDNKHVFFYTAYPETHKENKLVEVWDAQATLEYTRDKLASNKPTTPKLAVWNLNEDKVITLASTQHPTAYLSPNRTSALIFNSYQYVPKNGYVPKSDIWIKGINTEKNKKILDSFHFSMSTIGMSPNDRYVHYFKEKNWWLYDTQLETHRNLTEGVGDFAGIDAYTGKKNKPYDTASWSLDSHFLILHDKKGIWLIHPEKDKNSKIYIKADGGKRLKRYVNMYGISNTINPFDFFNDFADLKHGIILEAQGNDMSSGYYIWKPNNGLRKIIYENHKVSRLKISLNQKHYIVMRESVNLPYQLVSISNKDMHQNVLLRTNSHQKNYSWTKTELVHYTNSKGVQLKGILYYPANYEPQIKYPMVVYVYEKQSQDFHNYYTPTFYKTDGFNPIRYTNDGYFVFYPDIVYEIGNPGFSAVDCITSGVETVLEHNMINKKALGLIGHSFGGYETSFFITQSDLFAAAVAGGAPTNLVSHALSVDYNGVSRMWYYDSYQMRMGNMLYGNFDGYLLNSPTTHANRVQTPLLSWTGKADYHVGAEQSMMFHMALRNLNKRNVFLQYHAQGHILTNKEAQKDLSIRIKGWFDCYLKEKIKF